MFYQLSFLNESTPFDRDFYQRNACFSGRISMSVNKYLQMLLSLINQLKFYEFNVEVYGVRVKKGRGIDN